MSNDLYSRSTCSAIVITCSDFRFKSAERAFAEQLGLRDDYDLIARPGSIRSLVAPRSDALRSTLEDEIRLLYSVHTFPRALLVNHLSCRAYDDIAHSSNEIDIHSEHLRKAVDAFRVLMPNVEARAYFVDLNGAARPISTV